MLLLLAAGLDQWLALLGNSRQGTPHSPFPPRPVHAVHQDTRIRTVLIRKASGSHPWMGQQAPGRRAGGWSVEFGVWRMDGLFQERMHAEYRKKPQGNIQFEIRVRVRVGVDTSSPDCGFSNSNSNSIHTLPPYSLLPPLSAPPPPPPRHHSQTLTLTLALQSSKFQIILAPLLEDLPAPPYRVPFPFPPPIPFFVSQCGLLLVAFLAEASLWISVSVTSSSWLDGPDPYH